MIYNDVLEYFFLKKYQLFHVDKAREKGRNLSENRLIITKFNVKSFTDIYDQI